MTARDMLVSLTSLFIVVTAVAQEPRRAPTTRPGVPATALKPAPADGGPAVPKLELLKAGTPAPDFASSDIDGKAVRLSDFKDKVVVLDFWATWCGPCMQSLPHTQEAAKKFKDQGVVVLAVCTSDTRAKYEAWTKANQAKYADIIFTCDLHERGSTTFDERASKKLYCVSGIPTQYVIGRDGKVVAALVGYSSGDVRLDAALGEAGVKVAPAAGDKDKATAQPAAQ